MQAKYAKNKQEATRTLPPELIPLFQNHLEPLGLKQRAFIGMWKGKGAAMLAEDLESAGIERKNSFGIIDFHSFRTTIASLMNAAGISLVTIQQFLRHSDPKITANFYTRADLNDLAPILTLFRKFDDGSMEQEIKLPTGLHTA